MNLPIWKNIDDHGHLGWSVLHHQPAEDSATGVLRLNRIIRLEILCEVVDTFAVLQSIDIEILRHLRTVILTPKVETFLKILSTVLAECRHRTSINKHSCCDGTSCMECTGTLLVRALETGATS